MTLDLIDPGNFVSYNVSIARLLGLDVSIYLSELLRINRKAMQKNKLKDGYFVLDRKYMENRTTFTSGVQQRLDETLCELGLVEIQSKDNIKLNVGALTTLFNTDDTELTKSVEKWVKIKARASKQTKTQATANALKYYINCENQELQEAYECWIDGVYANPNGFLSKKSIAYFQNVIDNYCNHDLDLALNIITIATINGYRDPAWAISAWEKDKSFNYRIYDYAGRKNEVVTNVDVGEEVF